MRSYNEIAPSKQLIQTQAETYTVESYNGLIRHFLARFRRKTKCYSKSEEMIELTLKLLFAHKIKHYRYLITNSKNSIKNIINTRPQLFQKSVSSIWTDAYIQENLLNAHLDLSSDAASREKTSIKTTVDFIDQQIKVRSRILDLGCGPGLYAERFAERGHAVTGVDFNKRAIEYARKRSDKIEYIEADYTQYFPRGEYEAITMIYCDMGTHSDSDRDVLLRDCYESLEPGGKLIFDVFDESIADEKREGSSWEYAAQGGFWAEEEYLILSQIFHYPESRAFAYQYNLIQESETDHFIIWERYYTKEEVTYLLKRVGFRDISITSNLFADNNFTSSSEMFIVAER